jgi:hypothetical protein
MTLIHFFKDAHHLKRGAIIWKRFFLHNVTVDVRPTYTRDRGHLKYIPVGT